MSDPASKDTAAAAGSATPYGPPQTVAEPASSSESSTTGKNSGASVEASSSSSANVVDAEASSSSSATTGVMSEKPKSNTTPNNDPDDISKLLPILDSDLIANSHENQANDDAKVRASSYVVSLLSGDELFINKKDLLLAALEEHIAEKKKEQKRLDENAEKVKKETSKIEEEFATAHEVFRVADESARQAIEAREKAMEKLSTAIEKRMSARAKEKGAWSLVEVARASMLGALTRAGNAADAESAEVARKFLIKIQEDQRELSESGNVVHGINEKEGGDSHAAEANCRANGEENSNAKAEEPSQAGKKRGREEDLGVANESGAGDETPPRKAAKWDETQGENAGSADQPGLVGTIETDAVFGGVVFNSPMPASPSNLNFFSRSPSDKSSNENRNDHDSSQNSAIRFSSKLVREFALKAINEQRKSAGLHECPLLQPIFCVHRSSGEVFEGDAVTVLESVLIEGDAIVGIRHYRDLEMQAIMKPFYVLSSLLIEIEASESAEGDAEVNVNANDTSDAAAVNHGQTPAVHSDWWKLDGYPATLSERDATLRVARHLCTAGSAPGADDDARLSRSFFRSHWAQFLPGREGGVDLEFARTSLCLTLEGLEDSELAWPFPSREAWRVAMFQLRGGETLTPESVNILFPKFTLSLVAACSVLSVPPGNTRHAFGTRLPQGLYPTASEICKSVSFLLRAVCTNVKIGSERDVRRGAFLPGAWKWLSSSSPAVDRVVPGHFKFWMPLMLALPRLLASTRESMKNVIREVLEYLRNEASKADASKDAEAEYWYFKQGLVWQQCEDENDWQKKLFETQTWIANRIAASSSHPLQSVLSVLQEVQRIEGVSRTGGVLRICKLKKETVLQLNLQ